MDNFEWVFVSNFINALFDSLVEAWMNNLNNKTYCICKQ